MAYSPKVRNILLAALLFGWGVTLIYQAFKTSTSAPKLYRDNRILMGTFWEVSSPDPKASQIVFQEGARIEELLSKYKTTSEIFQLNRLGKLKVSPETFFIIKKSKEFSALSNGAFDITVGPLIDLWGFTRQNYRIPTPEEIQATLKLIGSEKIILQENDNVVVFKVPGMKIDLGAIAKGFALDCAIKKLKAKNITRCLINAGGQVYGLGDNFGQNWKIGIKGRTNSEISSVLELRDNSASTSADYEQFFVKDGKSYGHILDPRTGYPSEAGFFSVTVVSNNALTADALSTAIFVLGKTQGLDLAAKFKDLTVKIIP